MSVACDNIDFPRSFRACWLAICKNHLCSSTVGTNKQLHEEGDDRTGMRRSTS